MLPFFEFAKNNFHPEKNSNFNCYGFRRLISLMAPCPRIGFLLAIPRVLRLSEPLGKRKKLQKSTTERKGQRQANAKNCRRLWTFDGQNQLLVSLVLKVPTLTTELGLQRLLVLLSLWMGHQVAELQQPSRT